MWRLQESTSGLDLAVHDRERAPSGAELSQILIHHSLVDIQCDVVTLERFDILGQPNAVRLAESRQHL
jgi:hypothetical protein